MNLIRKTEDPLDLTEEEKRFLLSNVVNAEVKAAISPRRLDNMAVETSAYRKVGAAARAQADAILAVRALEEARAEAIALTAALDRAELAERDQRAAVAESDRLRAELTRAIGASAQVVHAGIE